MQFNLPSHLVECVARHPGPSLPEIDAAMRPAELVMDPVTMGAQKATRLSFTQLLARRMIEQRWSLSKELLQFDEHGRGRAIYQLDLGGHKATYILRSTPPITAEDAIANENLGRRVGTNRHVWGSLFVGKPDSARIAEEFLSIETKERYVIRAQSDLIGWTPGSRSARIFDDVVNALADGRQPSADVVQKSGYLIRNGGYVGNGRYGAVNYAGLPDGHPLKWPYFCDLFGILMLREVGVDLVNGMAAARSKRAVKLSRELSTYFGIGNASGLGMCVTLQRWTHWLSTWTLIREFCLARAKLMPAAGSERDYLATLVDRAIAYYDYVVPDTEEFMVSHKQIAAGLRTIKSWLAHISPGTKWGEVTKKAAASLDIETAELLNALLIDLYPAFADDVANYIPIGMTQGRDYSPEQSVGDFRTKFLSAYKWELQQDLGNSDTRRHFWYHSADFGEQRRGERVLDPHEHCESFTDHLGTIQRLAAVLAAYDDKTPMAYVVADHPELNFVVSRIETMAHRPYHEIHGNLLHKDFMPANLIRWYLTVVGLDSTYPLSIRWVPGVLFQGLPLWDEIAAGTNPDWKFASVAALGNAA